MTLPAPFDVSCAPFDRAALCRQATYVTPGQRLMRDLTAPFKPIYKALQEALRPLLDALPRDQHQEQHQIADRPLLRFPDELPWPAPPHRP